MMSLELEFSLLPSLRRKSFLPLHESRAGDREFADLKERVPPPTPPPIRMPALATSFIVLRAARRSSNGMKIGVVPPCMCSPDLDEAPERFHFLQHCCDFVTIFVCFVSEQKGEQKGEPRPFESIWCGCVCFLSS